MRGKPPSQQTAKTSEARIRSEHPLLIEVQQRLDEDVDLKSLADAFGYSPFHFHRVFTAKVGETPKEHIDRLRLEKGWLLVAVTDESILDIALAVGFGSHETFTRAFKRAYGETPTALRRKAKAGQAERLERNRTFRGEGCTLTDVRFVALPAMTMLAVRRVGPYSTSFLVPWTDADPYWRVLSGWAEANGVAHERLAYGFFYDIPGVTPEKAMRSDYAIPIATAPNDPGPFRVLDFQAGEVALTTHRGDYRTIDQAYRHVADGIRRAASRYGFADAPPFEIFREHAIGGDPTDNLTDVCFRVARFRR